jgi:hypothetical protein
VAGAFSCCQAHRYFTSFVEPAHHEIRETGFSPHRRDRPGTGCGKKDDPVAQAEKKDVAKGIAAPGIAETKAIAEEAYIYGFPMIAGYKAMYEMAIDKSSSQFKAPFNTIANDSTTATPKDTAVVTPNADTPYSVVWMDLRAEPVVLCVPEIAPPRWYAIQLTDLYTFNYAYVGTITTGNGAGCYMVAGPKWQGEKPANIAKVFRSETEYSIALYRTQLFNAADIENVKKVQAGYKVQTLSQFENRAAPPSAPAITFPPMTGDAAFKTDFASYLDFLLQFCPEVPEEKALRAKFASIGIGPGKKFDFDGPFGRAESAVGPRNQRGLFEDRMPGAMPLLRPSTAGK